MSENKNKKIIFMPADGNGLDDKLFFTHFPKLPAIIAGVLVLALIIGISALWTKNGTVELSEASMDGKRIEGLQAVYQIDRWSLLTGSTDEKGSVHSGDRIFIYDGDEPVACISLIGERKDTTVDGVYEWAATMRRYDSYMRLYSDAEDYTVTCDFWMDGFFASSTDELYSDRDYFQVVSD